MHLSPQSHAESAPPPGGRLGVPPAARRPEQLLWVQQWLSLPGYQQQEWERREYVLFI